MKLIIIFTCWIACTSALFVNVSQVYNQLASYNNFSSQLTNDGLLCITQVEKITEKFNSKSSHLFLEEILRAKFNLLEEFQSIDLNACYSAYQGLKVFWNEQNFLQNFKRNWERDFPKILQQINLLNLRSKEGSNEAYIFATFLFFLDPACFEFPRAKLNLTGDFNFNLTQFVENFIPSFLSASDYKRSFTNETIIRKCLKDITSFLQKNDEISLLEVLEMTLIGHEKGSFKDCSEKDLINFGQLKNYTELSLRKILEEPWEIFLAILQNAPMIDRGIVSGVNELRSGKYAISGRTLGKTLHLFLFSVFKVV